MPVDAYAECSPKSLLEASALRIACLIGDDRVPPIGSPLPAHFGNLIVDAMRQLNLLDEKGLKRLADLRMNITKIDLAQCGHFPYVVLSRLAQFDLESLSISDAGPSDSSTFDIGEFIRECVSDATLKCLRYLNIGGHDKMTNFSRIAQFSALESLSLSGRPICQSALKVVRDLPNLKLLDISNTLVADISALNELTNLEALLMHNLRIRSGCVTETLRSLSNLRVLDISKEVTDYGTDSSQEACVDLPLAMVQVMRDDPRASWQHLKSIDLAGNSLANMGVDRAADIVSLLLQRNPRLERVSVLATPLDGHSYVVPVERDVKIINCATRTQAVMALSDYWNTDRDAFTAHALHCVYYMLQSGYDDFSDNEVAECAAVVCAALRKHLHNLGVQMAGSACLYHLCKLKRISRLSISAVRKCVDRCLDAAETYPETTQLQKNVWLTICNDYLLQLSGINFYRTCKVALESMLINSDAGVSRMTIAIVSIVAPKMRSQDARVLASDVRYVKHLVHLMEQNLSHFRNSNSNGVRAENSLYTLKFTLSALWNLTDDCPATCVVFAHENGIGVSFDILRLFENHNNIQTKVLGILNNVAEVYEQKLLMLRNSQYLEALCECLDGDFTRADATGRNRAVERSYFAAGVLANMLLCEQWPHGARLSREDVNERMVKSIRQWPMLAVPMVSYRSFEPFVRILNETNLVGAQMWCLWGVNHVLSHSDANSVSMGYMTMLMESDLLAHCIRLSKDSSVDEGVRELAICIETNWLERTIHGMRVNAALTDQVESPSIPQICA
ncbi:leucine Rich repeat-containing domain protein [Ancylostoma caninum]|uniref:Leucine Rich repeat-containing domain protein n=1 Tax=Ancylostoma caninum TaxID=29170 RepID=A0A368FL83_ANCCA|nr:leucine Rich repeat-containing domain protein [Ancylostoma caninum]